MADSGDKLQDADKSEVNAKVAALRDTLQNGNVEAIKAGMDELQKAVYSVSEKLYQQAAPQVQPGGPQGPFDGQQPPQGGAPDGNVYDADYKDVE